MVPAVTTTDPEFNTPTVPKVCCVPVTTLTLEPVVTTVPALKVPPVTWTSCAPPAWPVARIVSAVPAVPEWTITAVN